MRSRDPELFANWGTICTPVQMEAADGKLRKIQAANIEGILWLIQSIPSPKAEPFKMWLAQVGRERIEETIDPELAIDRILSKEKYIGQVQKTYTLNYRSGKQEKNDNKLDMYLIDNAHEAIIGREVFDQIQKMKGQIKNSTGFRGCGRVSLL